jgi:DUF1680 family protein
VACCPSNLARALAQLPGLVYAQRADAVYVNLYVGSQTVVTTPAGRVTLVQETRYPWDGRVRLRVSPDRPSTFTVLMRIPGWARGEAVPSNLYGFAEPTAEQPALQVNGKAQKLEMDKGFARLRRRWRAGDIIDLDLPMPVRRGVANEAVEADRGKAAIQRGPLVYAVEFVDNGGRALNLTLPLDARLDTAFHPELLGGVQVVTGPATATDVNGTPHQTTLVAIPYYAWNNRGKGEMIVWIPTGR